MDIVTNIESMVEIWATWLCWKKTYPLSIFRALTHRCWMEVLEIRRTLKQNPTRGFSAGSTWSFLFNGNTEV